MRRQRDIALVWLVVLTTLSSPVWGQDKATFTFHVTQAKREGLNLSVEGESTTVQYKLSCVEKSKENTCYMPQAAKDYQAKLAPNPGYIYVYGISGGDAIFTIDAQQEKPRGNK